MAISMTGNTKIKCSIIDNTAPVPEKIIERGIEYYIKKRYPNIVLYESKNGIRTSYRYAELGATKEINGMGE